MTNITQLPGTAPNEALSEVCAETVEILERFLEKAKKGEIISVAIASVKPNRWTVTEYGGSASRNDTLTAATMLQGRMLHDHLFRE